MTTVSAVLRELRTDPGSILIRRWNWKSALYSSLIRSGLFFVVNLSAGTSAATSAMLTELAYRGLTAGFYGSLTQAFRKVEPCWKGALAALMLLMTISHSVEFGIHWLRGTPHLAGSIAASAMFTVLSTVFNIYAMCAKGYSSQTRRRARLPRTSAVCREFCGPSHVSLSVIPVQ